MNRVYDTPFLFITGMVRVLENRLPGGGVIESMLRAGDENEVLNILKNTPYSAYHSLSGDQFSTAELVENARAFLYSFIDKHSMGTGAGYILRLDHDYNNMKILIRRNLFHGDLPDRLSGLGNLDIDVMKGIFESEDYNSLPEMMRRAVSSAIEEYFVSKRNYTINTVFDRYMFSDMLSSSICAASSMIRDFIRRRIDAANIMNLLRMGQIRGSRDYIEYLFIDGGVIDPGYFMEGDAEPLKALSAIAVKNNLNGIRSALEQKAYMNYAVERECRRLMLGELAAADFMISGVEPLFAYGIRCDEEIRKIGMILSSKKPEFDRGIVETLIGAGGER